ncbi:MAG TPA: cellulose binding domain-containing protein [Actinocrinis sp.]|uniref:cellulose binding domain-containing protein n=1 Tax=Actinocrinis sp. TaxID=1920516 RepID=UPI002DDCFFBF|nr:cellulose binding domain-containing protein [Actinocrinis sp.]HEV2343537.1 cellulose binding domain-containing protein [Actinocrinis sp.]
MHKRGIALRAVVPMLALGLVPVSAAAASAAPAPAAASGVMACKATPVVSTAWQGGFDLQFVITNTGTVAFNEWTVTFDLPVGDTVYTTWNGEIQQSGQHVVATNYPSTGYNSLLAPGSSTTSFGMVVEGTGGDTISNVTCTPGLFPTQ